MNRRLLWDRACPLQRLWIARLRPHVADDVAIEESDRLALLEPEGEEYEGAHAVYRALRSGIPLSLYVITSGAAPSGRGTTHAAIARH